MTTMTTPHECLHEEQIQGQSRKIAELDTKSKYKEDAIRELKEANKRIEDKLDSLSEDVNKIVVASVKDDSALKDYITSLENRITSLESRQDTLYKLLLATPAIIALLGVIAIVIKYRY